MVRPAAVGYDAGAAGGPTAMLVNAVDSAFRYYGQSEAIECAKPGGARFCLA